MAVPCILRQFIVSCWYFLSYFSLCSQMKPPNCLIKCQCNNLFFCMVILSLGDRNQRFDNWCVVQKVWPPWVHCSLCSLMSASLWYHQRSKRSPGNISFKTFHFKAFHVVSDVGFECVTKKDVCLYCTLVCLLCATINNCYYCILNDHNCVKMKCFSFGSSERD